MNQAPNPYQPPTPQVLETESVDDTPYPASLGKRFGNFMIDAIAISIVTTGLAYVFRLVDPGAEIRDGLEFVITYTVVYLLPETLYGRTLGKLATGTKVVAKDGSKATFKQIALRTLIRFVPFDALSFLWGDSTGWHDNWSGTLVVPVTDPYAHIK